MKLGFKNVIHRSRGPFPAWSCCDSLFCFFVLFLLFFFFFFFFFFLKKKFCTRITKKIESFLRIIKNFIRFSFHLS